MRIIVLTSQDEADDVLLLVEDSEEQHIVNELADLNAKQKPEHRVHIHSQPPDSFAVAISFIEP